MAITPLFKGKKLEVTQHDDLDSDNIKSQNFGAGDDKKSRKINRKSRRNKKTKLSNAGDSEMSQTDPDSDFKESHSEGRTTRSSHKQAQRTTTKKNQSSDQESSGNYFTDPSLEFKESMTPNTRSTRGRPKKVKKVKKNKKRNSESQESLGSYLADRDSDFKDDKGSGGSSRGCPKKAKKVKKTRMVKAQNHSSDEERVGSFTDPDSDFKDDKVSANSTRGRPNYVKKTKMNHSSDQERLGSSTDPAGDYKDDKGFANSTRGRPNYVKKTKMTYSSDQESLGSYLTDPNSDFKNNSASASSSRGRPKKAKKTKMVTPSYEGSTADLRQCAFGNLSSNSENLQSSKNDSNGYLDEAIRSTRNKMSTENHLVSDLDLKENKYPSGSKVTLRARKSKRRKNSATEKRRSRTSNGSLAEVTPLENIKKTRLRREGTFEIQPANISKALRDSVLNNNSSISVRKSSQGTSSSRSVSFNYNTSKLSDASELKGRAAGKQSLATPRPQAKAVTLKVSTVDQPRSARKLWADSKFDPRSTYSPRPGPLEFSGIKVTSVKTPDVVQTAGHVRFGFATPPSASTPIHSVKKTPFLKEKLLKQASTYEKSTTNKSVNKSSLREKLPSNNSLGPGLLECTQNKPSNRGLSAGVRFEYSTPPKSSTPTNRSIKKTPFPKEALANEKFIGNKSANTSSRVKPPPNFSKIHERQYQKMENILELQQRRAARAQLLLSGCKPLDSFAANKSQNETTAKRPLFSPNKSTKISNLSSSMGGVKKLSKPVQKMLKKRASLEKKKPGSKLPVKVKNKPSPVTVTKPVAVKTIPVKIEKKPSPVKITKSATVKAISSKGPESRACATTSKYGFQPAHTSKTQTDLSTKKRQEVGKYRVNRRFELLMKMREKGK